MCVCVFNSSNKGEVGMQASAQAAACAKCVRYGSRARFGTGRRGEETGAASLPLLVRSAPDGVQNVAPLRGGHEEHNGEVQLPGHGEAVLRGRVGVHEAASKTKPQL